MLFRSGMTPDKMVEQTKEQALKRIQSRLVLEAIAEAEKIEVAEADIETEMQKMADMYQMELDKVKSFFTDEQIEEMKKDIATQKAVDVLYESAK